MNMTTTTAMSGAASSTAHTVHDVLGKNKNRAIKALPVVQNHYEKLEKLKDLSEKQAIESRIGAAAAINDLPETKVP